MRPRDALYYILTGKSFDGRRATEMGLVNEAVPARELPGEVRKLAGLLKSKNPVAMRAAKELFKLSLNMGYDEALSLALTKSREVTHLSEGRMAEGGRRTVHDGRIPSGLGDLSADRPARDIIRMSRKRGEHP